jgi:hypothetical protein
MLNRRDWIYMASAASAMGWAGSVNAAADLAASPGLLAGARAPSFKFVYECDVRLAETIDFGPTLEGTRRTIPITGGSLPVLRCTVRC